MLEIFWQKVLGHFKSWLPYCCDFLDWLRNVQTNPLFHLNDVVSFVNHFFFSIYFLMAPSCLYMSELWSEFLMIFVSSRKHTLMLYKGDTSFIPDSYIKNIQPNKFIANTPRFAGYQIAYMLWGRSFVILCYDWLAEMFTYWIFNSIYCIYNCCNIYVDSKVCFCVDAWAWCQRHSN